MRAILLTLALIAASLVTVQAQHDTYPEECDFDGDGRVSDAEAEECYGAYEAECDFDGDGRVSDAEAEKCHSAYGGHDECDFDGDGAVSPDEQKACEEQAAFEEECDLDGDGHVTESEAEQCYGAHETHQECDFDGDGTVTDKEQQDCDYYFSDDFCDFNGDGHVSEEEERGCYDPYYEAECDADGDGHITEEEGHECAEAYWVMECDFDGDGAVSEEEERECRSYYGDDECDFDGDGYVSEDEERDCYWFYGGDICDADGDGFVSDDEEADCDPESGDHPHYCEFDNEEHAEGGWSDECDGWVHGDPNDEHADERAEERRSAIAAAKRDGELGGQFAVRADGQEQKFTTDDGVKVTIDADPAQQGNGGISIQLDADLSEGRSFVFDIPSGILQLTDKLDISYGTVDPTTGETVENDIRQASNLVDVMNPDDDSGPEYWLVIDADGMHVMVSVPHWSVHSIQLGASVTGATEGNEGIPSVGLPLVGLGILGVAFVRRRN